MPPPPCIYSEAVVSTEPCGKNWEAVVWDLTGLNPDIWHMSTDKSEGGKRSFYIIKS